MKNIFAIIRVDSYDFGIIRPMVMDAICRFFSIATIIHASRLLLILFALLLVTRNASAYQTAQRQGLPTPKQIMGPETSPIATVNGSEVSLERFNRLYEARASRVRLRVGGIPQAIALNIKAVIATRLIDELLLEQAAKQRGVEVSDTDVDESLRQFAASFPSPEAFQRYIVTVPGGEQALQNKLRIRFLKEHLAGVGTDDRVSDEDAKAFYEQHHVLFNIPAHLTVQDVVFLVGADASAEVDNAQKAKAEAVLAQAKQPDVSFAALARQHSEGPTAKVGGDLGRVTPEYIDSALWKALSGMEPNHFSGVVKAADGYHILKLLRRNPEIRQSFEQVKERIKTAIQARRRFAKIVELITSLRAQAKIENHLAQRYTRPTFSLSFPEAIGTREGGLVAPVPVPEQLLKELGGTAVGSGTGQETHERRDQ